MAAQNTLRWSTDTHKHSLKLWQLAAERLSIVPGGKEPCRASGCCLACCETNTEHCVRFLTFFHRSKTYVYNHYPNTSWLFRFTVLLVTYHSYILQSLSIRTRKSVCLWVWLCVNHSCALTLPSQWTWSVSSPFRKRPSGWGCSLHLWCWQKPKRDHCYYSVLLLPDGERQEFILPVQTKYHKAFKFLLDFITHG